MAKIAVCVSVMLVLLAVLGECSSARNCCRNYLVKPFPVRLLKCYRVQSDTGYCNIKAVIFTTQRKRPLCANPDDEWVQDALKTVPKCPKKRN